MFDILGDMLFQEMTGGEKNQASNMHSEKNTKEQQDEKKKELSIDPSFFVHNFSSVKVMKIQPNLTQKDFWKLPEMWFHNLCIIETCKYKIAL